MPAAEDPAALRDAHPRLARVFDQLDGDGSGYLEKGEMHARVSAFGEETLADDLMATLDADGDGRVSFAEFVQGWGKYEARRMQGLFRAMDADKSNSIDADELEDALKTRFRIAPKLTRRLLKELDADGDGEVAPLEYVQRVSAAKEKGIFACCESGKPVDVLALYALLESGEASKNAPGENGMTPLMVAAASDNASAAAVLVEASADLEAVDQYRQTAMHKAATQDSLAVLDVLLNATSNAAPGERLAYVDGHDEQAPDGEWRRIDGAWVSTTEGAATLVNLQDQFGKTALHYAAENNYAKAASSLLRGGADPSAETAKGDTPAALAKAKGAADALDVIQRWVTP